jgi:hypothetical protein
MKTPEVEQDEDEDEGGRSKLIHLLAENLSIYAGDPTGDEKYLPAAKECLKQFRAAHQRDPIEYMELETFFLERQQGGHLKAVKSATDKGSAS